MVGEDWKELGRALGLQLGVLDGISKQKSDDVERCALVFKTWLKRGKRDEKVMKGHEYNDWDVIYVFMVFRRLSFNGLWWIFEGWMEQNLLLKSGQVQCTCKS